MSRILLGLSFASLMILIIGTTFFSQNPVFWLATGGALYQHAREALAAVLLIQLFTQPPRHLIFRFVSGLLAVAVGSWVVNATYNNHMLFLDSMSFLAASFAIALTALELQPASKPQIKKVTVNFL